MPESLYAKHKDTLKRAREVIGSREYWSPYPESPRAYGDQAPNEGEAAFESRLGKRFALDQAADSWIGGDETSAYGRDLGVTYPVVSVAKLLDNAVGAGDKWEGRLCGLGPESAWRSSIGSPRTLSRWPTP